jgi:acylphosphatase
VPAENGIALLESHGVMNEVRLARRYYVSGIVQGVGYRFFVEREARRLGLAGYVKNLRDGRVEVYAIGTPEQLRQLAAQLKRGPALASVEAVTETEATVESAYAQGFSIEQDWS